MMLFSSDVRILCILYIIKTASDICYGDIWHRFPFHTVVHHPFRPNTMSGFGHLKASATSADVVATQRQLFAQHLQFEDALKDAKGNIVCSGTSGPCDSCPCPFEMSSLRYVDK